MSFYGFFPQAPIGDVRVWICRSLSCMITGGDEMLEHACKKLGVRSGQTTPDGKLTVEFAECLGICDFAPAALADDGRIFGPLTPEKVDAMLDELKKGPVDPSHGLDRLARRRPSRPSDCRKSDPRDRVTIEDRRQPAPGEPGVPNRGRL